MRLTWCVTSCPGGRRMRPATGSWQQWCRSLPTCAKWTLRSRTWTSITRCGSRPATGPRAAEGTCCWSLTGWTRIFSPPGSPSVASLLPIPVGARTHVVVASRPHPELPDDVPAGHPLRVTPTQLSPFPGALELADLAKKEVNDLTHADDADLAVHILGLLTAAAGSLSVTDLVALRSDGHDPPTIADRLHVRRLVEDRAARSLEPVGPADGRPYQFAHSSLLEYAQTNQDLRNPEYRQRIHDWAERWRDAGWPTAADGEQGTPR